MAFLGAIFPFRWPFFGHFRPGATFHFLSHFLRIFVPILQMATAHARLSVHDLIKACEAVSWLDSFAESYRDAPFFQNF